MIAPSYGAAATTPLAVDNVVCIIRNLVDSNAGNKQSLTLQAGLSAREAACHIARAAGYRECSVSVQYEQQLGTVGICLEEQDENMSLGHMCSSGARRHNFTIHELDGTIPQKLQDNTTTEDSEAKKSQKVRINIFADTDDTSTSYSGNSSVIKPEICYAGLVNQAMTCYLNSLLQTLFMTPEFRNALYRWSFDGTNDEKVKSIPYQLQRLFLQLQTSNKRSVETTDLTRSFGWDSSEVWQQHDVQELCRVMFDALEQQWKNTVQANLINQLYQGKLKDYVKCLECGNESARVDAYLDIPLVIRPFGSTETYGSVREAMTAFVQPETLDGSNQYFCEKCNKKCNAHKGLKFMTFPYLLTLQLKRFDFDYATMHRIKLNDKVTFQDVLNLNEFISCESKDGEELEKEEEEDKLTDMSAAHVDSSDEGIDEGIDVEIDVAGSSSSDSSSISSDAAANNTRNAYHRDAKGPYVYELFSIMIHSGSAAGGHYYAYIKSFKDGQWYSFNDQQVSKITYEDIRKTYGGSALGRGFYSSAYTSSTSAYMLMYRQINKCLNADVMPPQDFPDHLKRELAMEKEREETERRQREIDKSTCKIKLYCFHPKDQHKMEAKLEVHKEKTLQEATMMARQLLGLESVVSPECCRLVKYDEYQDSLEKSFEGEESTSMGNLLGGVKSNYTFDLLLETRRPEQEFLEYKPGGVTVKVYVVDIEKDEIEAPVSVRASHLQTVQDFKLSVHKVIGLPCENMRCVLERFHNDLRPLNDPLRTLKAEGFYKSNKVFVECSGDLEDCSVPYETSRLYKLLDRYQHTTTIMCNLPSNRSVQEYLQTVREQRAKLQETLAKKNTHYSSSHSQSSQDNHEICGSDVRRSSVNPCSRSQEKDIDSVVTSSNGQITAKSDSQSQAGEDGHLSDFDSAFYSVATNSKHSLSGAEQSSGISICINRSNTPVVGSTATLNSKTEDNSNSDSVPKTGYEVPAHEREAGATGGHQVHVDLSALCSRLSSVGAPILAASHSDPSLYCSTSAVTGYDSDDSMRCLGSSGGRSPADVSADFNLSPHSLGGQEDPDANISSPEDGDGETNNLQNNVDEEEWWDLDRREQPQPLPSFLARTTSTSNLGPGPAWDANFGDQEDNGVEGCDVNLSLKGSSVCSNSAPLPPPPPPPPPPMPPSGLPLSNKLNLDLDRSTNRSVPSDKREELDEADVVRYFHGVVREGCDTDDSTLQVSVDKRITFGAFKQQLEPFVGVTSNLFKVYRVYSNNQEFESIRLSDTLSFSEDGKFNIKLGRALQPGEQRVKVFQLCLNEAEPFKFLVESIFAKGMTVLESKQMVLEEIREQCDMDIPLDRCRLRKKSWTNPCTVFLDSQVYETEIPIYPNWEIYLEVLDGPEQFVESNQLTVYVRHWHPSTHIIDRFQEVVLKARTVAELKSKISDLSGIPLEHLDFAKAKGTFPCEISVLEVNTYLEWNLHVTDLKDWPLYICDDGNIIFFRDNREELAELSEEKKKEIQVKENRTIHQTVRVSCSPRKEKALKIYTDDEPVRSITK